MGQARILTVDIETAPGVAYYWRPADDYIPPDRVIESSRTLCFAAKWLHEERVQFHAEWKDRPKMLDAAHRLLDTADVVITYNGNRFDLPRLRQELLIGDYPPPAPGYSVDLLPVVRRQFGAGFDYKRLDHVAQRLGLDGKHDHSGFDTWVGCMNGDTKAQREMRRYNIQDVRVTENVYLKLRPWIPNHPNIATIEGNDTGCPACGSARFKSHGWKHTAAGSYRRYRCKPCGHVFREAKRDGDRDVSDMRRALL